MSIIEKYKAAHELYKDLKRVCWLDLPEPVCEELKRNTKYIYLEERLYLFKKNTNGIDFYFMSEGGSPFEALRNYVIKFNDKKGEEE